MQNFRALGAPPQASLPPAAGGFAPKPPDPPPLRISGYAPTQQIDEKDKSDKCAVNPSAEVSLH